MILSRYHFFRNGLFTLVMACMIPGISACSNGLPIVSEVKETKGFTDPQTMVVVATERNRYRKVYTDQIWQVEVGEDGENFQTYLLGEIQEFLRELKTMELLADEYEIRLTSREREQMKTLASEFYDSLSQEDKNFIGAGEDDIYTLYETYHRANKLVDELTKDVNLEISDSEAKVITVQEIRLGDEGQAAEVLTRVTAEGADFLAIAQETSEDSVIEKQVGRSERDRTWEEPVFALENGQISPAFEDQGSWYIVKCINDYDEAATLERKEKLSIQRKNQAFKKIYEPFAQEHPVEISGKLWEEVSLTDGAESVTTDFFERYQEFIDQQQ